MRLFLLLSMIAILPGCADAYLVRFNNASIEEKHLAGQTFYVSGDQAHKLRAEIKWLDSHNIKYDLIANNLECRYSGVFMHPDECTFDAVQIINGNERVLPGTRIPFSSADTIGKVLQGSVPSEGKASLIHTTRTECHPYSDLCEFTIDKVIKN